MDRLTLLWFLLPDEALILLLVVGGFLVMFGLVSARAVLGVVVLLALLPVVAPLIEEGFAALPAWLAVVLLGVLGIWMLQMVATFVLGRGAADHMVGTLAADLVRLLVLATLLPLRLLWRCLWRTAGFAWNRRRTP
jgi:uncharacterized membrane protein